MPPRLFNDEDFKCGLSEPATIIFNRIAQSGVWAPQYKNEWGVVLPKQKLPDVEKHLKIISCTNQLSKAFEKIVIKWFFIFDRIDKDIFLYIYLYKIDDLQFPYGPSIENAIRQAKKMI